MHDIESRRVKGLGPLVDCRKCTVGYRVVDSYHAFKNAVCFPQELALEYLMEDENNKKHELPARQPSSIDATLNHQIHQEPQPCQKLSVVEAPAEVPQSAGANTSVINPVSPNNPAIQTPNMQINPPQYQHPEQQQQQQIMMPTAQPSSEVADKEQQSQQPQSRSQQPPSSPIAHKAIITKVKLSDELNIFDWSRTKELINQFAQRAKNSVETVMTTLDPGMKEYLYSGGNINIMVICDSEIMVSPVRDAFQSVFGRATVVAARYDSSSYHVKLAHEFEGAVKIAKEKISAFRNDTSNVPQNQVVVAIQPSLVHVLGSVNCPYPNQPFFTYALVIDDPILGVFESCYSQLIPLDVDIFNRVNSHSFPASSPLVGLGWSCSIEEIMAEKLKIPASDAVITNINTTIETPDWLSIWSGQQLGELINRTGISLAHTYQRLWAQCLGGDPA